MINIGHPTHSPTIMWSSRSQRLCLISVITVFPEQSLAYPGHLTPNLVNQVLSSTSLAFMSALTFQPCFWGPFCRIQGWWESSQLDEMAASPQSKPRVRTWRSPFPASQVLPAKNSVAGASIRLARQFSRNAWPKPGKECQEPRDRAFARRLSDLLSWAEREVALNATDSSPRVILSHSSTLLLFLVKFHPSALLERPQTIAALKFPQMVGLAYAQICLVLYWGIGEGGTDRLPSQLLHCMIRLFLILRMPFPF